MKGRNGDSILLDVDAVLQSIWSSDLSHLVFGSHFVDVCGRGVVGRGRRR
jgi:hypothetical protein